MSILALSGGLEVETPRRSGRDALLGRLDAGLDRGLPTRGDRGRSIEYTQSHQDLKEARWCR
jgi:hypothetical protein